MAEELIIEVIPLLPTTGARSGSNSFPRVNFRSVSFPFSFCFAKRTGAMPWEINHWRWHEPQYFLEFPAPQLEELFAGELAGEALDPLALTLLVAEVGSKIEELMDPIQSWFALFPAADRRFTDRERYDFECSGYEMLPKTFTVKRGL